MIKNDQREQTLEDLEAVKEILEQRKYELSQVPLSVITVLTLWKLSALSGAVSMVSLMT